MIRTVLHLLPDAERRRVPGYVLLMLLSLTLRAAGTVLLVPLVAALFGSDPAEALPWLAVLTACTVIGWLLDARVAGIGYDLGFAMLDHAQRSVAERLSRVPLGWFSAERTATARQAIAATGPELVGLIAYLITPLTQALLLPVAIGLALLPIAWPLGLAALAGVPVVLGALWSTGRITRRADRVAASANSALTERVLEFARTQQALRAARRVEPARSHAGAALAAQHGATVRLLLLQVPGQLLFSVASQVALVVLAGATTVLAFRGDVTAPEAVALIVVIARYLEAFGALGDLAPAIENARATLGRIREVLDAPVPDSGPAVADSIAAPRVELRQVTFGYDEGAPVLDKLSVAFEPGRTTAIVGPSGSGKSTILALVAGLQEPAGGSVMVDGVERDGSAATALTSMVFQHPYLFDGTIRANVLAGHPEATEDQLARVLALARVDEVAARLPDGLDTVVGEGGAALSGGERQRVSIARALLKPAPVLLIDEATSALDAENEAAVVAAVAAGSPVDGEPATRIVVAHRLSTIAGADRVLFLDGGRIVEDGTVDELLAASGRFAEFWRQQHVAASWRLRTEA